MNTKIFTFGVILLATLVLGNLGWSALSVHMRVSKAKASCAQDYPEWAYSPLVYQSEILPRCIDIRSGN